MELLQADIDVCFLLEFRGPLFEALPGLLFPEDLPDFLFNAIEMANLARTEFYHVKDMKAPLGLDQIADFSFSQIFDRPIKGRGQFPLFKFTHVSALGTLIPGIPRQHRIEFLPLL